MAHTQVVLVVRVSCWGWCGGCVGEPEPERSGGGGERAGRFWPVWAGSLGLAGLFAVWAGGSGVTGVTCGVSRFGHRASCPVLRGLSSCRGRNVRRSYCRFRGRSRARLNPHLKIRRVGGWGLHVGVGVPGDVAGGGVDSSGADGVDGAAGAVPVADGFAAVAVALRGVGFASPLVRGGGVASSC